MILTITLNPSVDKTYIVYKFSPNMLNRAHKVMFNAGSKGINVSRVVSLLGRDTCALGFVGGDTGKVLIRKLSEEGIAFDPISLENFETRLNIKIMDLSLGQVTGLNELGEAISHNDYLLLVEKYRKKLPYADIVVISGSLLPGMLLGTYYDLIKIAAEFNKPVFLDCGGAVLKASLKASPFCIKPNIYEFEDMLQKTNLSEDEVIAHSKAIIENYGINRVVVTLGQQGVIGVTKDEAIKVIPPAVKVNSTVGAGDAFLAGMCQGFLNNISFSNQLVLGTSCASAKVTKEGNNIPSLIELLGYTDGCRVINL
ncbi:MAG: 1-phosphofructokinase family hexose kinase [Clostridiaceae bacterium]|nr:1-phosphofructokinase family hexose kinase [Clostridiaceae bacterium]